MGENIVDIDDNLRIIGTAHVSTASVELVREQIEEWKPNLVAVELCDSRLRSLQQPDDLDNDDLLKIINEGCLLYTSPSPRDYAASRMPSSA